MCTRFSDKFRTTSARGRKSTKTGEKSRINVFIAAKRSIKCGQTERARIKTRGEKTIGWRSSGHRNRLSRFHRPNYLSSLLISASPFIRFSGPRVTLSFLFSLPRLCSDRKKRTAKLIESILCAIHARNGNAYFSLRGEPTRSK